MLECEGSGPREVPGQAAEQGAGAPRRPAPPQGLETGAKTPPDAGVRPGLVDSGELL